MSTIETDELKPWWIKLKEALEQKNEDNYCKVDATDLEFSIEDYQRIHQQLQSIHTRLVAAVDKLPVYYRPIQINGDYSKRDESSDIIEMYSKAQVDTIINSIFKE